ncbi:hypothetical protein OAM56_06720 [Alphaproteobacteria bacterium]|nr:hypothetical protein [Alphaproteobacteria bacterium]
MKSLNLDIIFPWEAGLVISLFSIGIIIFGVKQSKKTQVDFDNIPIIKPTTKIFFGSVFLIFGLIQLLPLLKV